ncbi:haloacid dehalogenase [uncultured Fibrobacter sp.]|uniref:haloacid dehalogenase n=1 Tax=uncultured Fibrobacter sp. TaxID=261512 RepID=UPI0025937D63|nr:haloacid dehalogenase [uncultured Fibrobacter sp.]
MKRTFLSLDIFDTCLIRKCGEPRKIWDLMADELFDKEDYCGRLSFVGNRSVVEKRMMDENFYPTLNDIYEEFNVSQWGFESSQIMQLEMELEERELCPNPQMLDVVNKYRLEGFSVSFISDMYLPSVFLKKILVKHGFCKENEKVYVSAECKASKNDGSLFDYVFKDTGTKAKQWIHYGDNEKSDYLEPKSKGVKSFWIKNTLFTDEEKRWISDARFYTHKHEIELWAGLCRYARVNLDDSECTERAVDLISSLYIPYVRYIMDVSKEQEISVLYFLARDAHVFLQIAEQFKNRYPNIELKYLKLSRRALYPCVFYEVNDYEMELTICQCIAQTAKKSVEYIGLEWESLSPKTRNQFNADYRFTSARKAKAFAKCLIENDRKMILEKSSNYREMLLGYLRQEGVLGFRKIASVDLGWIGSCRCILNYILKKEKYRTCDAFYWGASNMLMKGTIDDRLYVFQRQYDISHYSSGSDLFFEHYASINDEESTVGYIKKKNEFFPIKKKTNDVDREMVVLNESVLTWFAKKYMSTALDREAMRDVFLCCGLRQLQNLQDKPNSRDLKFFSFISTENFGCVIKLVQPLLLKNIFALLVWGIPAEPQWLPAAIKKTFGPFAELFVKTYNYTSRTKLAHLLRLWWNR